MAQKSFGFPTEPHTATVNGVDLQFVPVVMGAEYLDQAEKMNEAIADAIKNHSVPSEEKGGKPRLTAAGLKLQETAIREFLRSFLVPDSVGAFDEMKIPTGALTEMSNWISETYGGSLRPTGSSSASPGRSPRGGRRSTGSSPNKA